MEKELNRQLPLWTWIAPIFILLMARFVGPFGFMKPGYYLIYLPYLVGSVLVLWWGPRVVIGICFASLMGSYFGSHLDGLGIALLAIAEGLKVYLGWWFFKYLKVYQLKLHRAGPLFYFWIMTFVLPDFIGSYINMAVLTLGGVFSHDKFISDFLQMALSDASMTLVLSLPIFIFLSHWMTQKGWTLWSKSPFSLQ